ncbi:MAG: hypothetical protein AAGB01_08505 [Cyanobacteria bacterium P01_F01_bin.42]
MSQSFIPKRIGQLLVEANLLTPAQVQVALYDQRQFDTMRLGEIVVFRGWLDQQTVDFFGDRWVDLCAQRVIQRKPIGEYLCAAGLMDHNCVERTVQEQNRNGYRFGANAVLLGFIKQQTLDYFLANLFPEQQNKDHYMLTPQSVRANAPERTTGSNRSADDNEKLMLRAKKRRKASKSGNKNPDDDISWVG